MLMPIPYLMPMPCCHHDVHQTCVSSCALLCTIMPQCLCIIMCPIMCPTLSHSASVCHEFMIATWCCQGCSVESTDTSYLGYPEHPFHTPVRHQLDTNQGLHQNVCSCPCLRLVTTMLPPCCACLKLVHPHQYLSVCLLTSTFLCAFCLSVSQVHGRHMVLSHGGVSGFV